MQNIWFFSEDTSYHHKNKEKTRSWIRRVIKSEGYRTGQLNIIFCSDAYLSEINSKYLNHNTLTDIVTFDLSEGPRTIAGEIYISVDRAGENAATFHVEVREEISRLIVHGILHLAGYKDKAPADKSAMTRKEDYYLSLHAI